MLKSAGTAFYNADADRQAATLYRIMDSALERNKFQCAKGEMAKFFDGAGHALREMRKMDTMLDGEEWPSAMQALKKNLLRTSQLDEACESWAGNDRAVLPALRSRYLEVGGVAATTKLDFFEKRTTRRARTLTGEQEAGKEVSVTDDDKHPNPSSTGEVDSNEQRPSCPNKPRISD